jgi:hypothetical protein
VLKYHPLAFRKGNARGDAVPTKYAGRPDTACVLADLSSSSPEKDSVAAMTSLRQAPLLSCRILVPAHRLGAARIWFKHSKMFVCPTGEPGGIETRFADKLTARVCDTTYLGSSSRTFLRATVAAKLVASLARLLR